MQRFKIPCFSKIKTFVNIRAAKKTPKNKCPTLQVLRFLTLVLIVSYRKLIPTCDVDTGKSLQKTQPRSLIYKSNQKILVRFFFVSLSIFKLILLL